LFISNPKNSFALKVTKNRDFRVKIKTLRSNMILGAKPPSDIILYLVIHYFPHMGETTLTLIGVVIGIFLGVGAVTFLLDLLAGSVELISMFSSGAGLLLLIAIAAFLIIKIRVINSLISGAIIGIVLNILAKAIIGEDIATLVISQFGL